MPTVTVMFASTMEGTAEFSVNKVELREQWQAVALEALL
jgi:hypothetical protein